MEFTRRFFWRAYIDNVLHTNEVALLTENKQIIRGDKEYYRSEAEIPPVPIQSGTSRDNLALDEHKYLLQIEKSKGREQKSEIREQKSEVREQKSEVREQKSEVREQKSKVREQKSKVREEKTEEDLTSDLRSLNSENCYFSEIFIIAYGGNTTLNQLFTALRDNLAKFDEKIDVVVL